MARRRWCMGFRFSYRRDVLVDIGGSMAKTFQYLVRIESQSTGWRYVTLSTSRSWCGANFRNCIKAFKTTFTAFSSPSFPCLDGGDLSVGEDDYLYMVPATNLQLAVESSILQTQQMHLRSFNAKLSSCYPRSREQRFFYHSSQRPQNIDRNCHI